ncbi:MAG: SoxR reducing system RseC family protein [Elusimicrobia bacterium]|nr:SoxR reducing system RseC family protein [Elusimicrobiota bacterium]
MNFCEILWLIVESLRKQGYLVEEIATVVEISGNRLKLSFTLLDSKHLTGFTRQEMCKKCGSCQKSENGIMYLELENSIGAKVGDKVLVKIEPSNLKISAILYGIPSTMLIIGIFLGYFLFNSEIYGFLTGFIFLFISFLVIKKSIKKYKPKIEKII